MGRILLVGRLAVRDLRRRPGEAVLLLLAIMAATATLTLGLVLRGVTDDPYQSTRDGDGGARRRRRRRRPRHARSTGPPTRPHSTALADAPGVVAHSGPYPVITADVEANGRTGTAHAIGRDTTPAAVDQPALTDGTWVDDGGVVVEAAFADALDARRRRSDHARRPAVPRRRCRRHRGHAAVSGDLLLRPRLLGAHRRGLAHARPTRSAWRPTRAPATASRGGAPPASCTWRWLTRPPPARSSPSTPATESSEAG